MCVTQCIRIELYNNVICLWRVFSGLLLAKFARIFSHEIFPPFNIYLVELRVVEWHYLWLLTHCCGALWLWTPLRSSNPNMRLERVYILCASTQHKLLLSIHSSASHSVILTCHTTCGTCPVVGHVHNMHIHNMQSCVQNSQYTITNHITDASVIKVPHFGVQSPQESFEAKWLTDPLKNCTNWTYQGKDGR